MNRFLVGFLAAALLAVAMPVTLQMLSAGEPATKAAGKVDESLEVRYARAYLELAEANLDNAAAVNRKVPDAVPDSVISPLRQVVVIAEAQLQHALHKDSHDLHTVHVRQAEMAEQEAEQDLQRVLTINRSAAGVVSLGELQQARLRLRVAELGLEKAREVEDDDPLAHMQWQLEELRKEMLQLRSEVAKFSL